jgi:hypothetical protein
LGLTTAPAVSQVSECFQSNPIRRLASELANYRGLVCLLSHQSGCNGGTYTEKCNVLFTPILIATIKVE